MRGEDGGRRRDQNYYCGQMPASDSYSFTCQTHDASIALTFDLIKHGSRAHLWTNLLQRFGHKAFSLIMAIDTLAGRPSAALRTHFSLHNCWPPCCLANPWRRQRWLKHLQARPSTSSKRESSSASLPPAPAGDNCAGSPIGTARAPASEACMAGRNKNKYLARPTIQQLTASRGAKPCCSAFGGLSRGCSSRTSPPNYMVYKLQTKVNIIEMIGQGFLKATDDGFLMCYAFHPFLLDGELQVTDPSTWKLDVAHLGLD